jgi:hypothetical protein
MFSRTLLSRCLLPAAVVLAVFSARSTQAQRLEDGQVQFETKARATRALRLDLFGGKVTVDPKDKTHQEAVEMAAKEVVYPLYWQTNAKTDLPDPGKMNMMVEQFETRLLQLLRVRGDTSQLQQMFCRQVIDRAQEVIQAGKPIAGVNAARILAKIPERAMERGTPQKEKDWVAQVLPRLGEGNAEHLAGVLLTLLENPKTNDGIKYYVLRGLSSLLALPKQSPALLKKETEEKAIRAAIAMVEKKTVFPQRVARGEVEGYKVLRREAVRVVAQVGVPVLGDKDRPALVLARVAGNDESIQPPPRLDERIEAAIGLARMGALAAKYPDFQPDYAMFQIAQAVLEFGLQAAKNLADSKGPPTRSRPWKIDAARLGEAVEMMKGDVKNTYVQQVADQCLLVLNAIENGGQGGANNLGDWLAKNSVPAKTLFKSVPDSAVNPAGEKPAEKAAEKPAEKPTEKAAEKPAEKAKGKGKDKPKDK